MAESTELPFWLRQFIAWVNQNSGLEKVPERETAWPDYFDNTIGIGEVKRTLFYKDSRTGILLPFKGRGKPVPVEKKIGIECHITAVSFGTTKRARKFWLNAINEDLVPDWNRWAVISPGSGLFREKAAERMALHQRFWKVPYHYVALLNGDILYNNPISRYSHHGNGGNGPMVGVSSEANLPGLEKYRKKKHHDIDGFFIETSRAMIQLAVKDSRKRGSPIELMTAHRQYSKGRLGDPGEGWWKEIGKPMSKELKLTIKYNFKHGSGNYMCNEWDDEALYNYRGRRIRDPSVSPNA